MSSPKDNKESEERKQKSVTGPLPLDWTRVQRPPEEENDNHPVRFPWEVTCIDKNDEEIVIVGTAGQKITKMGSNLGDHCNPKLKQLVFRSHLIQTMEGIDTFEDLELLELYDNMITKLQALDEGCNYAPGFTLKILDMSYNVIRDMEPVSSCPNLRELYLANNKIKSMAGLRNLKHLVKIDLGANKIRVIEPEELDALENLEELWLGKNKIEKIEGLTKLTKLRRLDIQSNRLKSVENLTSQIETLEELYLAHNGINDDGASQPTGLGLKFSQLSVVDLSRNFLTTTKPFAHLTTLDELWLSGNKIESFDQISPLSTLTALDTVYLEYNPIADDFEYRKNVKQIIPSLNQIDANLILGSTARGFNSVGGKHETYEEQMRRLQEMALTKAKNEGELRKVET